jgi:hypothetical protein
MFPKMFPKAHSISLGQKWQKHKYTKAILAATNEVRQHATRGPGFFFLWEEGGGVGFLFDPNVFQRNFLCNPNMFPITPHFFISYPLP